MLKKEWPTFLIGIGLGASKDLVIKAGKKGTGINDNIWIGDAVVDASKLSDEGSIDEIGPIVMDECFYVNIKDFYVNSKEKYGDCLRRFHSAKLGAVSYHCDRVMSDFDDWIDREFNI